MALFLVASFVLLPSENIKGVNYYPSRHSWESMWLDWDSAAISMELGLAEELGLNVVETYLHYPFFFLEDSGRMRDDLVNRMDEFLSLADGRGLKVIYTLFDFTPTHSLTRWRFHQEYLKRIIERFGEDRRILLWGIRNEINVQGDPVDTLVVWADSVATFIKGRDTLHPVELEFSGSELSDLEQSAAPFVAALKNRVDCFALSFYGETESLPSLVRWLRHETGKPVTVSEFGFPTSSPEGEDGQREHFERTLSSLRRTNTGFRFWTLMDFTAEHLPVKERSFGVFYPDYRPKSVCSVLTAYPEY